MHHTVITVASSILLSAVTVTATPLLQVLSPRSDVSVTGYAYGGCVTEATKTRALSGNSYFDDLMTVEKCAAACSSFTSFGVEYGRECYCGNSVNPGSQSAPESDCSFPCPGNAAEYCGGGNRLNMYSKSVSDLSVSSSRTTTYSSLGCYTEATVGRALTGLTVADDTMTVEKCSKSCAGFSMFGLEYYREVCTNFTRQ